MELMDCQLVEKESLSSSHFKSELTIKQDPLLRKQIEQAAILGNVYHSKVNIYFMDDEGYKRVNTTIWAYGQSFILLKGGIFIPIDHIVRVEI